MEHDEEWLNNVISKFLGHEKLMPWQLSAISSLRSGQDVFAVAPTGAGKSTVMQGAVLADMAEGKKSIAIIIVPTKSLGDDQARAVNRLNIPGIKALALHEDAVGDANCQRPRRDLFREVQEGMYSHVFLGPEMIMSSGFEEILKDSKFYKWFRYFGVDEVHLTKEWKEFRGSFAKLHRLRNRFRAPVAWVALSATVEPVQEFRALADSLGFNLKPGRTKVIRLPVDRPTISYSPRFLQYSVVDDQRDFPDLSYLVPWSLERISNIPPTIVFGGTIKQVSRIAKYLRTLLPTSLDYESRRGAIIPLNRTLSANHNGKTVSKLRMGKKTRIVTSTTMGALGIDVENIERVVIIAERGTSYRMICQEMGRIRTSGRAVILFPGWMDVTRANSTDTAKQAEVEPVIIEFANATVDRCPRAINVEYWGDLHAEDPEGSRPPVPPSECCNRHNPGLDTADLQEVKARTKDLKAKKIAQDPPLRSDRTHPAPDRIVMQPIARELIGAWRQEQLERMLGYEPHLPFSAVLPDHYINTLVTKLHICSTFDRFQQLMKGWSHLDELGHSLYMLVETIWEAFGSVEGSGMIKDIRNERGAAEKARAHLSTETAETREVDQNSHVTAPAGNASAPPAPVPSTQRPSKQPSKGLSLKKTGR